MSVLISSATGNLTSSTTWSLVSAASYNNSEAANTALTTSSVASSTFVPTAVAIDAVAIKLASVVASPTGTITVELFNSTGASIALTQTINCSDLPLANTTKNQGGWIVFKFSSTVTPNGTDSYSVRAKTSVAAQVNLYSLATTNWARAVRTTTNQAPVAGDDMIIAGEHTGAGTGNSFVVTNDQTATTAYGSGTTGSAPLVVALPAVAICKRGSLIFGSSASTNFVLRLSGSLVVYGQGNLQLGTVAGTTIPITSTAVLEFLIATADGDFGLIFRAESTGGGAGVARTSGKNVVATTLNANYASGTTLTVTDDTGWLNGDSIVIASTNKAVTPQQNEAATVSSVTSSTIVLSGGLSNAHLGSTIAYTSANNGMSYSLPRKAHVINLTRNVSVRSTNSVLHAYVYIDTTAAVSFDWAEFKFLGANVAGKRGIEIDTTTGSASLTHCSVHDCRNFGLYLGPTQAAWGGVTIQNTVLYALGTLGNSGVTILTKTSNQNSIIDNVTAVGIGTLSSNAAFEIREAMIQFTNIVVAGCLAQGFGAIWVPATNQGEIITQTWGPITTYSNSGQCTQFQDSGLNLTIAGFYSWRNVTGFTTSLNGCVLTIDPFYSMGDGLAAFGVESAGMFFLKNGFMCGDTTFTTGTGFYSDYSDGLLVLDNMELSPTAVTGQAKFTSCDIQSNLTPTNYRVIGRNTPFLATAPIGTFTAYSDYAVISTDWGNNHLMGTRGGTSSYDSVIFNTASPSQRLTPVSSTKKLASAPPAFVSPGGIKVPVSSGAATIISVNVRKSVSTDAGGANYNGNQQRLIQRANPSLGQNADVVLATAAAAVGVWEKLSATSSVPTNDGAFEFVVDCDGTAGWVNVDDWSRS